jgi:hypothetical protein
MRMAKNEPDGNTTALAASQALAYVAEARKCRRHRRRAAQAAGLSALGLFTLIAVSAAFPAWLSPIIAEALIFLFLTVAGGGLMWYLALSSYLGDIVRKSEASGEKNRIGVVIDTYIMLTGIENMPFRDKKRSASLEPRLMSTANTIAEVFRTFDESDVANLLPEHHSTLYKLITHHDPNVANGVLAGLGAVGNERDLQFMLSLTNSTTARAPDTLEQLNASIAQIETRLERQQQGAELLRPGSPDTTPAQLLRPVMAQQESQEKEQLLRAGME